jgi:toxin YoeB
MEIIILPKAQEHIDFYKKSGDKKSLKRFAILVRAIIENPFEGIGKPEALKYQLSGKWSRRIDKENRIVYTIIENTLYIYSAKGHY